MVRTGEDKAIQPSPGEDSKREGAGAGGPPRPLSGYAELMAVYGAGSLTLLALLRRSGRDFPRLGPMDLVLYALATEHLSRLITKDSVTSVLRAPFTRYEGPAGPSEVNEEPVGHGLRRAVGELVSCPFCAGQWVATGLMAGTIAAPRVTRAVVSVSAVARLSDYLQFLYAYANDKVG
jgi:hypothetical protein